MNSLYRIKSNQTTQISRISRQAYFLTELERMTYDIVMI